MKDLNRSKITGTKPKGGVGPKNFKPSRAAERVKAGMIVASVLICAAAAGGAIGFGIRKAHTFFVTSPYFAVKNIDVTGMEKLDRNKVLALAGLKEGQNIFSVDSDKAVQLISSDPWVKGVTVRKQFPDRIVIRVVERKAGAMVRNSQFWLVDEDGEIFKRAEWTDGMDYPVITIEGDTGDGGVNSEKLSKAMSLLRIAGTGGQLPQGRISEVIVAADGRITLYTSGDTTRVEFGAGDMKEQWAVLETVLADARNNGLRPTSVNLNYESGAAVKLAPMKPRTLVADSRDSEPNP